jgi:hypothetical protein
VLESVIARQISSLSEEHWSSLPSTGGPTSAGP